MKKKTVKFLILIYSIALVIWGIGILVERPTYADSGFDASYDSDSSSSGGSSSSSSLSSSYRFRIIWRTYYIS